MQMIKKHTPLIIAGPTASGKSDYALDLAQKLGGVIINADSMQIYKELPILTAHPSEADQAVVPHKLYGALDGDDACSAARWRELAIQEINICHEQGLKPILVGGTGLYLMALTKGLSQIPEVDPDVRNQARDLMAEQGSEAFYEQLIRLDPLIEGRLNAHDSQRLVRAYEVKVSTGISITQWQSKPPEEAGIPCEMIVVDRPRPVLHQRAASRFETMLKAGALDEVAALQTRSYNPDLPVMRAVGVKELASHIKGETSLQTATDLAIIATRQLIKRQLTFFRNQFSDAERVLLAE